MMYRVVIAAIVSIAASFVSAQVEIVDRKIPTNASATSSSRSPVASSAGAAEMYYQMQVLQQEVQQLRGMVEQQTHEIKKLKQQRLDDYLDLDRRLSQVSSKTGAAATASNGSNNTNVTASAAPPGVGSSANEMQDYRQAMNLVFKEKKYDEAIVALEKHLDQYPRGRFAANAQYWLGEVFLLKTDYEQARQWFSRVLGEFPDHTKVPDAQYKLGKVYHLLGDADTAKNLLQKVAASNTNAARLAQDYLDSSFSQ